MELLTDTAIAEIESEPARPARSLAEPWTLGGVEIANRVVLAPLAGIGNWFVRLQAKRYGAGLVTSEMVSSFAVHYRNERTCTELLRIHPDEHPVAVQLFGHDPDVMESAAERVAAAERMISGSSPKSWIDTGPPSRSRSSIRNSSVQVLRLP